MFFVLCFAGSAAAYMFRGDFREARLEAVKAELPRPVKMPVAEAIDVEPIAMAEPIAVELVAVPVNEINLDVPFSPQAPTKNWDMPYQEACEEISAILVDAFHRHQAVSVTDADAAIQKLVEYEKQRFGFYEHTTTADTATMLRDYFGYTHVEVAYDFSLEDLKKELRAGRPVIVPLAGRAIGNPYYSGDGPVYHMVVVRGFTNDGRIITNDVGTRHGENYPFDENVFFDAIHDAPASGATWNSPDPENSILSGRKAMVVVYPEMRL